jgi:hypothetical protein
LPIDKILKKEKTGLGAELQGEEKLLIKLSISTWHFGADAYFTRIWAQSPLHL